MLGFRPFAPAGLALALTISAADADVSTIPPCVDDAMIVFDASGSMSGNEKLGIATTITRIDEVRSALARVLPSATRFRRVGLITYGPGPYNQCNVELNLNPTPNAANLIMREVSGLMPAGKTPLTSAVEQAANVLDFRNKPGVVVVLTDGEETCAGSPCDLGKQLHAEAYQLTIHVISFRADNFSWMGEQSIQEAKCLAEENGGLYTTADTQDELVAAFQSTLDCPMISERAIR
ncbi:MAG: vWA domain-containing protein [Methyloceanibacter sp.]|uniref:vWA domain-containing protein n=1 Tax=Methyloceanibacter sp. TaxID=1965321 RepID=UPI003D6D91BC